MGKSRLIKKYTYFYQKAAVDEKYTKWGLKIPVKLIMTTHGWNQPLEFWKKRFKILHKLAELP